MKMFFFSQKQFSSYEGRGKIGTKLGRLIVGLMMIDVTFTNMWDMTLFQLKYSQFLYLLCHIFSTSIDKIFASNKHISIDFTQC